MPQPEYSLLVNGAVIVECCELRKKQLEKEYEVVVRYSIENAGKKVLQHCELGCLFN